MKFEFTTATRIVFGPGAVREAGTLAKGLGTRALVVTGRNPRRAQKVIDSLESQSVVTVTFSFAGEPQIETVEQGTAAARQADCDLVVACGGGSAIDAGKAIAAMLTNPGELLDYLEIVGRAKNLPESPAPFIAIPTTAGTGSEVTRNAVLAATEQKVKVSLRSPLMLPRVALVDPELTYDLPPDLTATTGLDALTQLIEPYVCSRANPMTDAMCIDGLRRVARSLRGAFVDGRNKSAREDMALASLFGGLALANAGLGAAHGFAGPIGGMFPAPHGGICAALLSPIMEANLRALRQRQPDGESLRRYQEAACLLTGTHDASAEQAIDWVRSLVSDLKIPGLRAYGISSADGEELVERALQASSMKANPLALTRPELLAAFEAAL
jgi:alcohol dehydrogenase class IV